MDLLAWFESPNPGQIYLVEQSGETEQSIMEMTLPRVRGGYSGRRDRRGSGSRGIMLPRRAPAPAPASPHTSRNV